MGRQQVRTTRRFPAPVGMLAVGMLAIGIVIVGGCGSSSGSAVATPSSTRAPVEDLCTVITPADAESVFGAPGTARPHSGSTTGLTGACLYKKDGTAPTVDLLQVRVYDGTKYYGARLFRHPEAVEILGADRAFERVGTGKGGATTYDLQFVKHGKTGAINYVATGGTSTTASSAALRALADKLARSL
ncbi:MAG: hypothetical protein ABJC79_01700 [Acidimicrobiia bacterium]